MEDTECCFWRDRHKCFEQPPRLWPTRWFLPSRTCPSRWWHLPRLASSCRRYSFFSDVLISVIVSTAHYYLDSKMKFRRFKSFRGCVKRVHESQQIVRLLLRGIHRRSIFILKCTWTVNVFLHRGPTSKKQHASPAIFFSRVAES